MPEALVKRTEFVKTRPRKNADHIGYTRADYLTSIGLSFDPFAHQDVEGELSFYDPFVPHEDEGSQGGFSPLAYFVSPDYEGKNGVSLFAELQSARPSFVFGEQGSGKTMLRLGLEAICRRRHGKTLVVTFSRLDELMRSRSRSQRQNPQNYWEYLTGDLATDLLIQIIEQYDFYNRRPDDAQTEELARLLNLAGGNLWRIIDRLLKLEETPPGRYGLGEYWGSVKRFPIHYVIWSPRLLDWLVRLRAYKQAKRDESGEAAFRRGVAAAATWGFENILVLVDDIHDWWLRKTPEMEKLVARLLQTAVSWNKQGVTFKFFLNNDLRPWAEKWARKREHEALQPALIDLNWKDEKLRELLRARFRAAGSHLGGLGDLGLGEKIDNLLIHNAKGSPAHLLRLVSELIDKYLDSDSEDLAITRDDWERAHNKVRLLESRPRSRHTEVVEHPATLVLDNVPDPF